jgi:hypothetical protein
MANHIALVIIGTLFDGDSNIWSGIDIESVIDGLPLGIDFDVAMAIGTGHIPVRGIGRDVFFTAALAFHENNRYILIFSIMLSGEILFNGLGSSKSFLYL